PEQKDDAAELAAAKTKAKTELDKLVAGAGAKIIDEATTLTTKPLVENCTAGFATGALNHLKSFVKSRQKEIDDSGITTADDVTKVKAALEKLKKSTDKTIKDTVVPRVEVIHKLSEKGDDKSKALAKLIRDNFIRELETDHPATSYQDNLPKLESKLAELKKYAKGGENEAVYNGLGTDEKKTFDALLKSVEDRVEAMKAAEKDAKKSNVKKLSEGG
ncbi:10896_t:CDS:2, partial [Ambispora leptoticha]